MILRQNNVSVPESEVASSPAQVRDIVGKFGDKAVIKAQIHAGGRGKAGGVKVVSSLDEAEKYAKSLLGQRLVTHQTTSDGVPVNQLLVEEALLVKRELYLSFVLDGSSQGVYVIASEAGGMDIEDVTEKNPDKIIGIKIDPMFGLQSYQSRNLAYSLSIESENLRAVTKLIDNLYGVFEKYDCSMVEINPLVITDDGRVLAADAKLSFDDDALFRHPDLLELRDMDQEEPLEAQAKQFDISYVKLDGNVGCMVNGAGLAMATMDVAESAGASPANFLDVGGSADENKVSEALKIILADPSVDTVLVNIFGGILRCDIVARGILMASKAMPGSVRPMVVRMLGTNAEEGRKIISESDVKALLVDDLEEAANAIKSLG